MATTKKTGTGKRAGAKASSASARRAKLNAANTSTAVITEVASVIPWIIKFSIVGTVGYLIYKSYTNRFESLKENKNYPPSNITEAQATIRANAIYSGIGWFSNDFENVLAQFDQMNYNAVIKIYNAFGKRSGTLFGGELDLFEWCRNQFTADEIAQLRFKTNGAFFN